MNKLEFIRRFQHLRNIEPEQDFPLKKPGKPAAVLIPIIERETQLTVLFTQRSSHLKHHPGQVSFPGGKQETSDKDLIETALRETHEEIGISPEKINVLGNLHRFRTVSRYEVTPFVSLVNPHFTLLLDKNEVESVFEVPLVYLLDSQNHFVHWAKRNGKQQPIYFIPWQDRMIWGATAAFVKVLSKHIFS